ncbi:MULTISPECIES: transglycosylase SLT domain-containing protein [Halomonadaceae]|uniref:transglycosylase SLT domain-containing protein n=1 Tax=Halomonadaceae TaxID=28256 RepID=UPI00159B4401|nr:MULTISPECIES: transglycosylase SLT domain-containing protein [Halomonas]QJQ96238.1 transglycosylase SLT domain-containing protein [Halomonas sp. PA5]
MIHLASRRLVTLLAGALLCLSFGQLATAQGHPVQNERSIHATERYFYFWHAVLLEPRSAADAWARLRESFQWQDKRYHSRVQEWIDRYRANPHNIVAITERARPWLYWITEQLDARGLPGEIALLPFVESSFDPYARSSRGASGLWQFMPGTSDALGLARNGVYDGRMDVLASTQAALDYIEQQARQWYEGDLFLSLAAYNAGAGTVNKARQVASSQGEPDDYWHLRLPRETMNYLPKLLAIAAIIDDPEAHDIALPDIEDAPGFAKINIYQPIDLTEAATLANLDREELEALNPGLLNGSISPEYSSVLLVPSDSEELLMAQLDSMEPMISSTGWESYVVAQGDSLSSIASRFGASVDLIRQHNGLAGDTIRTGQVLEVPQRTLAAN